MISVIISAYDQHELTIVHVAKCMESTRVPDEIIVVNDGGEDSLKGMIERVKRSCPIVYAKIIPDIPWNQNGARNLGLFLSRGDMVAIEDNDHIPEKRFYEEAEKLLEKYDKVSPKNRPMVSLENALKGEMIQIKTKGTARIISMCKREVLTDIKGFDEQFCGRYGWDVPDFLERAERRGIKEIFNGQYYVVECLSREKDREFQGWATKMAPVNYHHRRRNARQKRTQSSIGILNFDYTITRYA